MGPTKQQRRVLAEEALATLTLEGLELTKSELAVVQRYADGEITSEELSAWAKEAPGD